MTTIRTFAVALCGAILLCNPAAGDDLGLTAEARNSDAPAELDHWAAMMGEWHATWEALGDNGEVTATGVADWNWSWALDGFAIADVWINPSLSVETGSARLNGVNLRIYNPAEGEWQLSWMNSRQLRLDTYVAHSDAERVVMIPDSNPDGERVTFFNMTGDSFDWVQEVSADGGQSWSANFRIHGERPQ